MTFTSGISASVWLTYFRNRRSSAPLAEHAFGVDDIVFPFNCESDQRAYRRG
jgi:hypothetical protein